MNSSHPGKYHPSPAATTFWFEPSTVGSLRSEHSIVSHNRLYQNSILINSIPNRCLKYQQTLPISSKIHCLRTHQASPSCNLWKSINTIIYMQLKVSPKLIFYESIIKITRWCRRSIFILHGNNTNFLVLGNFKRKDHKANRLLFEIHQIFTLMKDLTHASDDIKYETIY